MKYSLLIFLCLTACYKTFQPVVLNCRVEKYESSGVCYLKFFPDQPAIEGSITHDMLDKNGYLNYTKRIKCSSFRGENHRAVLTLKQMNDHYLKGEPLEKSFIISADIKLQ